MRLVLRLPRDPATVPITRHTVDCALDAIGVAAECRQDVGLAVTEVCANVVGHAKDAVDYTVTVTATGSRCTIDVRDAGGGPPAESSLTAPTGVRPAPTGESGRGLGIVRGLMDAVQVVVGPRGVAVHMVKRLIFGRNAKLRPATDSPGPG
jgi:serine/threonine-protein kinase RsbW